MAASILGSLEDSLRRAVPLLSGLVLLAASFTQLPLPYAGSLMPPLALMGIFYWSIYRPDRFGVVGAFALGLLQDLVTGAPLGLTAFLYAVVQRGLRVQQARFKGASFVMLWLGYLAVQALVSLIQWLVWSSLGGAPYPPAPFVLQLVLALCLFPPVGWTLSRLHTAFLHH